MTPFTSLTYFLMLLNLTPTHTALSAFLSREIRRSLAKFIFSSSHQNPLPLVKAQNHKLGGQQKKLYNFVIVLRALIIICHSSIWIKSFWKFFQIKLIISKFTRFLLAIKRRFSNCCKKTLREKWKCLLFVWVFFSVDTLV